MKKEAMERRLTGKVMTYRNTNKRVVKLIKLGLIQDMKQPKPDPTNIHGRKDYMLTPRGLAALVLNTAGTLSRKDAITVSDYVWRMMSKDKQWTEFSESTKFPGGTSKLIIYNNVGVSFLCEMLLDNLKANIVPLDGFAKFIGRADLTRKLHEAMNNLEAEIMKQLSHPILESKSEEIEDVDMAQTPKARTTKTTSRKKNLT